jgi:hypothetical protein
VGDIFPEIDALVLRSSGEGGGNIPVTLRLFDKLESFGALSARFVPVTFANGKNEVATSTATGSLVFSTSKAIYGPTGTYYFELVSGSGSCKGDRLIR